jgi:hypothetical protein
MDFMNSTPYIIEPVRLVGNRRVLRISDPRAGLSLEKLLQPTEPIAVQKKALERAMDKLLKERTRNEELISRLSLSPFSSAQMLTGKTFFPI